MASQRYVEVWSSGATLTGYDLAVVDPSVPNTLIAVDQVPRFASAFQLLAHIYGGDWDPASGTLLDPGLRHLVYQKNGAIHRVTLDKGGAAPTAVRLSNESQAQAGPVYVLAQSRDGSDALISYTAGAAAGQRVVSLRTPPDSPPMTAPTFPGDPLRANEWGWTLDPSTGAISSLLWSSVMAGGGSRLFRTDASLGNATTLATYGNLNLTYPWSGTSAYNGGRMARGRFFVADGALRRHDDATGDIRLVYPNVTGQFGEGVFDDTHVYLRLNTSAGAQLVRAPDSADSTGVSISSQAIVSGAGVIMKQTRDYLVFIGGSGGTTATTIRKSDGAQATLPNPNVGGSFSWIVGGGVGGALFLLGGNTAGNRVWYSYAGVVGSIHADGSDRKELSGGVSTIAAFPSATAPHRVIDAIRGLTFPFSRFMLNANGEWRWIDATSGDAVATVGSMPGALALAGASLPYYRNLIGRYGALGLAGDRADAWLVSDQPGSLVRLTNNIT